VGAHAAGRHGYYRPGFKEYRHRADTGLHERPHRLFGRIEVSDYAVADLGALVRIGFVQGAGGKLNPKTTFTRAESAVLLNRILIM
jgi:hypothetical protein